MAGKVSKKLFGIIAGVILSLTGISAEFCVPGTETAPQIDGIIDASDTRFWAKTKIMSQRLFPRSQEL